MDASGRTTERRDRSCAARVKETHYTKYINRRTKKNAFERNAYTNTRVQRTPVAPRKPAANDKITLNIRLSHISPSLKNINAGTQQIYNRHKQRYQ